MPNSNLIVDTRYLDLDFTTEASYTFGALPGSLFSATPTNYEDAVGVIPEVEWPAHIEAIDADPNGWMEFYIRIIMNQGQEGSCVSFAQAQQFEILQGLQYGIENIIPMSPMSLYRRIGSSAQSGSMLSDALAEMRVNGMLPLDTAANKLRFAHTHPATGWNNKLPADYQTTSSQFLILEWFDIRTVQGLVSALLRQCPVVVGRDGHSICYVRPFFRNNQIAVYYANSWGSWGQALSRFTTGFGVDSLSKIKSSAQWAYAARSISVPVLAA